MTEVLDKSRKRCTDKPQNIMVILKTNTQTEKRTDSQQKIERKSAMTYIHVICVEENLNIQKLLQDSSPEQKDQRL